MTREVLSRWSCEAERIEEGGSGKEPKEMLERDSGVFILNLDKTTRQRKLYFGGEGQRSGNGDRNVWGYIQACLGNMHPKSQRGLRWRRWNGHPDLQGSSERADRRRRCGSEGKGSRRGDDGTEEVDGEGETREATHRKLGEEDGAVCDRPSGRKTGSQVGKK